MKSKRLGGALELSSHRVVIRLPHLKLLQMLIRTAIVAAFLLSTLRRISTVGSSSSPSSDDPDRDRDLSFVGDLHRLGLIRATGRSVYLTTATTGDDELQTLVSNRIEPVDANLKAEIEDSSIDFLLFDQSIDFAFVHRVLKPGGIVAVRSTSDRFILSPNFKIAYTSHSVIAIRKLAHHRKLLSVPNSIKKALTELEDAILEPPTRPNYRQKTRYLPDVMEGSLSDYPRRVFVDVEPAGKGSERWFEERYPKQGSEFEVVRIEEASDGGGKAEGLNEWLKGNVREEEYVVMKAEAEVVEEMMRGKVIGLVDDLFLECRNQWMRGEKSKRAYWECLALYGRLKDEGVAVHQWWD